MRLLLAAIIAVGFSGPALADALKRITDTGVIRLGVRTDAPPFSYLDPNGNPAGLAVALCEEVSHSIARQVGHDRLVIEYVPVNSAERFPALLEGRTDLHCGPASVTLKRRETLDFSLLYFVDGAAAAERPGSYEAVFTAKFGRIGYLVGTTTEAVVRDLMARNDIDAELQGFTSHDAGLHALANGVLDLYFGDQAILLFQISSRNLADRLHVVEEIFSFEPYALVMKRGESDLRLAVDRALSQIYDLGHIYQMIREELGPYPLSSEVKAVYQIVGLPE